MIRKVIAQHFWRMRVSTKILFEILRDKIFNFIDCEVKKRINIIFQSRIKK